MAGSVVCLMEGEDEATHKVIERVLLCAEEAGRFRRSFSPRRAREWQSARCDPGERASDEDDRGGDLLVALLQRLTRLQGCDFQYRTKRQGSARLRVPGTNGDGTS